MSTNSMPRSTAAADWRKGNGHAAAKPLGTADYLSNFFPPKPWYEQGAGRRLSEASYQRIKRALDIVLCILGLPLVLPILGLCAIAIKLDSSGPVFFAQLRTGRGGRRFKMYKLRTMVQDAPELKAKYMHLNELSYPDFKISNDPRITRLGRILRKTSLDELPEIFSVLRGEMTLVGPRPTSFSADTYTLWHTARLEITPGITGLWQVSGRGEVSFDQRLRLDIAYIRNRSLSLDIQILFRTVGAVLSGRGAN
jgi:lipopolysaccharide/colanic/teichoic acid biosynthesis glycosyltransferase